MKEVLRGDGTVLYSDCGGGYMITCVKIHGSAHVHNQLNLTLC